ncbi:MAG: response regulator transcription factor [Saprospiraceae bacterium]|nr:response regulator transcription factor [Saprospiraceae bacterium]
MDNIKIIIIEDEAIIAQDLALTLTKEGYIVSAIAMSYKKAIEALNNNPFDIALVDINLNAEKTGIELGRIIHNQYNKPFIYLTSYSDKETMRSVLPTHPSGYLIKPIKKNDLRNALEIAVYNYLKYHSNLVENRDTKNHFYIKNGKTFVKILKSDIHYVKAFDNYAFLYQKNNKILVTETLKSIESKLSEFNFKRVHRSYLVNINQIEGIEDKSIRIGDQLIPVSRQNQSWFFSSLNVL